MRALVLALLALAACAPSHLVVAPGEPRPPATLGQVLDAVAANSLPRLDPDPEAPPTTARSVLRAELATAEAEPIYEVRIFPDDDEAVVSTFTVLPPPQVTVHLLPRRDNLLETDVLTIWLTTGGQEGVLERDAWLVFSSTLLEEPVNWGSFDEPVLQLVQFDTVLPFPGLQITDHGTRFHRQPTSGIVQIHGAVRLTEPLYFQLVVEAPEENDLGYVVTHAYGLIPGGE